MDENELNYEQRFTQDHDDWFSSVIENSTALISRFLPDSTITYVNQTFCKYFNTTKEKLIGKKWIDFLPENDKVRVHPIISNFHSMMAPIIIQSEILSCLSNSRIFNLENSPVKDKNGKFIGEYQFIATDITEQKHVITDLENSAERLRESNTKKDKFISLIAHDLRSPFQGLLGISKWLIEDGNISLDERLIYELKLYNELKNQFALLDSLLLWSRIQLGAIEFKPEKNNLILDIEESIALLNPTVFKKNLILKTEFPLSLFAYYDRDAISIVIQNLISNAVKFTKQGGEIIITATSLDDDVICSVKDNGIGISEEKIKNFFRIDLHNSTRGTDGENGFGFGLNICKELIEKHRGRIWVESKPDSGSVFYFTIPIDSNS